ncbi:MAG: thioredoxin domain-containing protein [Bryobacteraceae bacterium]
MAQVGVAVYEDLQCSDCAAFRKVLDEVILPRYGSRIVVEHHDFPLPKHGWARSAAIAARHFQEVNDELGNAFRREMLANISGISVATFVNHMVRFAKSHGVDPEDAIGALLDVRLRGSVEQDYRIGQALGVVRTPTVFVDGAPFIETFTVEEISAGIDRALAFRRSLLT